MIEEKIDRDGVPKKEKTRNVYSKYKKILILLICKVP